MRIYQVIVLFVGSFLLTKVIILLVLSFNRVQDSGKEHSIKTCTDKQDNTQVGKKNCTNQQLWYDIIIIFNYVQNVMWVMIMISCSLIFPLSVSSSSPPLSLLQEPTFFHLHHQLTHRLAVDNLIDFFFSSLSGLISNIFTYSLLTVLLHVCPVVSHQLKSPSMTPWLPSFQLSRLPFRF